MTNRVYEADPREFTLDPNNKNKGTKRGRDLIQKSFEQTGAGRGIAVDGDGYVIAGNHALQAAVDAGMKIVVVETDGDELVVTKRRDMKGEKGMRSPGSIANQMALADNISARENLDLDFDLLAKDMQDGADFVTEYIFVEELIAEGVGLDAIHTEEIKTGEVEKEEVVVARFDPGSVIMLGDHTLRVGSTVDDVEVMVRAWEKKTGFTARTV